MEGVLAIIMIFGMPVFIVGINKYFKYRTARLRIEERTAVSDEERQRLKTMEKERALLVQRVENLESIVTSVDFELNSRLNRLAAQQSRLALPPGPGAAAGGGTRPAALAGEDATRAANAVTVAARSLAGELPTGTLLMERYRVERLVGRGGMGAVYQAHDTRLGEAVALKIMTSHGAEDSAAVDRFHREVGAARKITHPNVIRIHDLGEDDGLLFVSMELFAGQDLGKLLARRGTLPLDEARPILLQVCDALAAAHAAGVVHRDLKPQNILVNERSEVKVIDFGLAKASYMRSMTATGLIMGTPEYMSPEQVRGRPTDHRTDIYALGAVAYHVLGGRPPFAADSPIAVGFLHCSEPPRPLRELKPELPEQVEATVLRCLAKDPAGRFDTVTEVKAALA